MRSVLCMHGFALAKSFSEPCFRPGCAAEIIGAPKRRNASAPRSIPRLENNKKKNGEKNEPAISDLMYDNS